MDDGRGSRIREKGSMEQRGRRERLEEKKRLPGEMLVVKMRQGKRLGLFICCVRKFGLVHVLSCDSSCRSNALGAHRTQHFHQGTISVGFQFSNIDIISV